MRKRWLVIGAVGASVGCRGYQDPLPFEDCQPYVLECGLCTIEDDLAQTGGLRRAYRCETGDGVAYDVVLRDAEDPTADEDLHYYDPDSGYRAAAERRYPEPVDVCGKDRDVEWYGEILDDCEIVCELDGTLVDADPELASCE